MDSSVIAFLCQTLTGMMLFSVRLFKSGLAEPDKIACKEKASFGVGKSG
jgi:hypothetical protein